jgi:hypothetical protein
MSLISKLLDKVSLSFENILDKHISSTIDKYLEKGILNIQQTKNSEPDLNVSYSYYINVLYNREQAVTLFSGVSTANDNVDAAKAAYDASVSKRDAVLNAYKKAYNNGGSSIDVDAAIHDLDDAFKRSIINTKVDFIPEIKL